MKWIIYFMLWLMVITPITCKSNEKKEMNADESIEQEKDYSKVKFAVECYGINPTIEEIFFYYEIKRREYLVILQREKDDIPINLTEIRKNMVANNKGNPYIQYDFLNPWKEPPVVSRGGQNRARTFWPNPNGYRYSAPINVKPGHLF